MDDLQKYQPAAKKMSDIETNGSTNLTIDQLNQQAWEIRVSDSNKAFTLSKEALSLSEKTGYTKGKAEALRTAGLCHVRLSQNDEAQACFDQALELFDALNDTGGKGYVYTGFGIIQRNLGYYKASLQWFFKSLELIKETKYAEAFCFLTKKMTYMLLLGMSQNGSSKNKNCKNRSPKFADFYYFGDLFRIDRHN